MRGCVLQTASTFRQCARLQLPTVRKSSLCGFCCASTLIAAQGLLCMHSRSWPCLQCAGRGDVRKARPQASLGQTAGKPESRPCEQTLLRYWVQVKESVPFTSDVDPGMPLGQGAARRWAHLRQQLRGRAAWSKRYLLTRKTVFVIIVPCRRFMCVCRSGAVQAGRPTGELCLERT
jgi:hypothetical protein